MTELNLKQIYNNDAGIHALVDSCVETFQNAGAQGLRSLFDSLVCALRIVNEDVALEVESWVEREDVGAFSDIAEKLTSQIH